MKIRMMKWTRISVLMKMMNQFQITKKMVLNEKEGLSIPKPTKYILVIYNFQNLSHEHVLVLGTKSLNQQAGKR